jgi:ATP-dependent RNA helicase DeaD
LLHRSGRTGRAGKKGTAAVLVPAPLRRAADRLFHLARVQGSWSSPPSADEIRGRDQARLVVEVAELARDAAEDELAAARAILVERSPEEIAAALVRLHRARLPAPEELTAVPTRPIHPERGPRAARAESKGAVWFRMDVGRVNDADPRWLIPLICKRGGITKAEIGAIRIGQRETRFEIAADAADAFADQARRGGKGRDREVRIEPVNRR